VVSIFCPHLNQGPYICYRSIGDNDAPDVAEAFYAHLFNHGAKMLPDTTEAARALHLAVRKLRAKNVSFRQWVPFIHLGI
jgi:hypothetical protein